MVEFFKKFLNKSEFFLLCAIAFVFPMHKRIIPVVILLCDPDMNLARSVALEIRPHALQLLGRETPAFVKELKSWCSCQVWKTIHLTEISGQASPGEYVEAGADGGHCGLY